ncbi:MAG: TetR/AcrR family transcriptional regulator [Proteobacteria bacterium]|nr:TetR/AcrR family transcriptional regulator [Pseudomonadota bacterium]
MKTIGSTHASSQTRRRKIISAALACFAEKGVHATSMEDIRVRAGASNGSIYHHFKSKEQLAAAVLLEGLRNHQADLLAVLERQTEARPGIFALVHFHLQWVEDHPDWARFIFQMREADAAAEVEPDIRRANRKIFRQLLEWLEGHVRTGAIKRLPREMYLPLIWGPCLAYERNRLSGRPMIDSQFAGEVLAESIWASIKGEAEGGTHG